MSNKMFMRVEDVAEEMGVSVPPHHPDVCGLRTRIPDRTALRAMMARSPKAASFKRTDGKAVPLTA